MDQSNSGIKSELRSSSSSATPEVKSSRPAHRRTRNSRNSRQVEKGSSKDGESLLTNGHSRSTPSSQLGQGKNSRAKDDSTPRSGQGKNSRAKDDSTPRSGQGKRNRAKDDSALRSIDNKDGRRGENKGKNKQKSSQERFLVGIGAGIQRLKPKPVYKRKQNPDGFIVATPPTYTPNCDICSEIITDSHSAISLGTTGLASHFDCVVNYLAKRENLGESEHIVYLGAGEFGVAKIKTEKEPLEVLRRITYEDSRHENNAWRRELALTPSFVVRVLKTTDMIKDEESRAFRQDNNSKKYKN